MAVSNVVIIALLIVAILIALKISLDCRKYKNGLIQTRRFFLLIGHGLILSGIWIVILTLNGIFRKNAPAIITAITMAVCSFTMGISHIWYCRE